MVGEGDIRLNGSAEDSELVSAVYGELRALAQAIVRQRRPISTQTTSLIHDAYLRLTHRGLQFNDRSHFLCIAAKAMRCALVDRARRESAAKRGGGQVAMSIDDVVAPAVDAETMLAVDEAMSRLAAFDARKARIVELRFFGGLTVEEAAEATGLSPATIKREWSLARAWLHRELSHTRSG